MNNKSKASSSRLLTSKSQCHRAESFILHFDRVLECIFNGQVVTEMKRFESAFSGLSSLLDDLLTARSSISDNAFSDDVQKHPIEKLISIILQWLRSSSDSFLIETKHLFVKVFKLLLWSFPHNNRNSCMNNFLKQQVKRVILLEQNKLSLIKEILFIELQSFLSSSVTNIHQQNERICYLSKLLYFLFQTETVRAELFQSNKQLTTNTYSLEVFHAGLFSRLITVWTCVYPPSLAIVNSKSSDCYELYLVAMVMIAFGRILCPVLVNVQSYTLSFRRELQQMCSVAQACREPFTMGLSNLKLNDVLRTIFITATRAIFMSFASCSYDGLVDKELNLTTNELPLTRSMDRNDVSLFIGSLAQIIKSASTYLTSFSESKHKSIFEISNDEFVTCCSYIFRGSCKILFKLVFMENKKEECSLHISTFCPHLWIHWDHSLLRQDLDESYEPIHKQLHPQFTDAMCYALDLIWALTVNDSKMQIQFCSIYKAHKTLIPLFYSLVKSIVLQWRETRMKTKLPSNLLLEKLSLVICTLLSKSADNIKLCCQEMFKSSSQDSFLHYGIAAIECPKTVGCLCAMITSFHEVESIRANFVNWFQEDLGFYNVLLSISASKNKLAMKQVCNMLITWDLFVQFDYKQYGDVASFLQCIEVHLNDAAFVKLVLGVALKHVFLLKSDLHALIKLSPEIIEKYKDQVCIIETLLLLLLRTADNSLMERMSCAVVMKVMTIHCTHSAIIFTGCSLLKKWIAMQNKTGSVVMNEEIDRVISVTFCCDNLAKMVLELFHATLSSHDSACQSEILQTIVTLLHFAILSNCLIDLSLFTQDHSFMSFLVNIPPEDERLLKMSTSLLETINDSCSSKCKQSLANDSFCRMMTMLRRVLHSSCPNSDCDLLSAAVKTCCIDERSLPYCLDGLVTFFDEHLDMLDKSLIESVWIAVMDGISAASALNLCLHPSHQTSLIVKPLKLFDFSAPSCSGLNRLILSRPDILDRTSGFLDIFVEVMTRRYESGQINSSLMQLFHALCLHDANKEDFLESSIVINLLLKIWRQNKNSCAITSSIYQAICVLVSTTDGPNVDELCFSHRHIQKFLKHRDFFHLCCQALQRMCHMEGKKRTSSQEDIMNIVYFWQLFQYIPFDCEELEVFLTIPRSLEFIAICLHTYKDNCHIVPLICQCLYTIFINTTQCPSCKVKIDKVLPNKIDISGEGKMCAVEIIIDVCILHASKLTTTKELELLCHAEESILNGVSLFSMMAIDAIFTLLKDETIYLGSWCLYHYDFFPDCVAYLFQPPTSRSSTWRGCSEAYLNALKICLPTVKEINDNTEMNTIGCDAWEQMVILLLRGISQCQLNNFAVSQILSVIKLLCSTEESLLLLVETMVMVPSGRAIFVELLAQSVAISDVSRFQIVCDIVRAIGSRSTTIPNQESLEQDEVIKIVCLRFNTMPVSDEDAPYCPVWLLIFDDRERLSMFVTSITKAMEIFATDVVLLRDSVLPLISACMNTLLTAVVDLGDASCSIAPLIHSLCGTILTNHLQDTSMVLQCLKILHNPRLHCETGTWFFQNSQHVNDQRVRIIHDILDYHCLSIMVNSQPCRASQKVIQMLMKLLCAFLSGNLISEGSRTIKIPLLSMARLVDGKFKVSSLWSGKTENCVCSSIMSKWEVICRFGDVEMSLMVDVLRHQLASSPCLQTLISEYSKMGSLLLEAFKRQKFNIAPEILFFWYSLLQQECLHLDSLAVVGWQRDLCDIFLEVCANADACKEMKKIEVCCDSIQCILKDLLVRYSKMNDVVGLYILAIWIEASGLWIQLWWTSLECICSTQMTDESISDNDRLRVSASLCQVLCLMLSLSNNASVSPTILLQQQSYNTLVRENEWVRSRSSTLSLLLKLLNMCKSTDQYTVESICQLLNTLLVHVKFPSVSEEEKQKELNIEVSLLQRVFYLLSTYWETESSTWLQSLCDCIWAYHSTSVSIWRDSIQVNGDLTECFIDIMQNLVEEEEDIGVFRSVLRLFHVLIKTRHCMTHSCSARLLCVMHTVMKVLEESTCIEITNENELTCISEVKHLISEIMIPPNRTDLVGYNKGMSLEITNHTELANGLGNGVTTSDSTIVCDEHIISLLSVNIDEIFPFPFIVDQEQVNCCFLDNNMFKALWRYRVIAVKLYKHESFMMEEMKNLIVLRDPRILSVLGYCQSMTLERITSLTNATLPDTYEYTSGGVLLLEFMENLDLRTWLNSSYASMTLLIRLRIAVDIAEAMRLLHGLKMIHGKLMSSHVLLDVQSRAKLSGFGGAVREFHHEHRYVFNDENQNIDVYCFGVILWELQTGKVPWQEKLEKHTKLMLPAKVSKTSHTELTNLMYHCMESVKNVSKITLSFVEIHHKLCQMLEQEQKRIEDIGKAIPDGFICPITQDVMKDPVILIGDGHSYERKAISDWLQRSNRSPLTNEIVIFNNNGKFDLGDNVSPIIENYSLKSAIESFFDLRNKLL